MPLPSLSRLFFFAGIEGSLKTQTSKKIQKPTHLAGKKSAKGSVWARQTRVQISWSVSRKRRGHWTLKKFWGCMLEPSCTLLQICDKGYAQYSWIARTRYSFVTAVTATKNHCSAGDVGFTTEIGDVRFGRFSDVHESVCFRIPFRVDYATLCYRKK